MGGAGPLTHSTPTEEQLQHTPKTIGPKDNGPKCTKVGPGDGLLSYAGWSVSPTDLLASASPLMGLQRHHQAWRCMCVLGI